MRLTIGFIALWSIVTIGSTRAEPPKKPAKPPVKNQDVTKGQGQVQGGDGVFGTIYTLNSGWNLSLLKARYSVEPYNSYNGLFAKEDEKLLLLSLAIKNSLPTDLFFNGLEWQFVDEEGHDYTSSDYRLNSDGNKGTAINMKPGQGVGQFPEKDEFTVAVAIPAKARISKIILKDGRKFVKGEEVVRYFVSNVATKDRDGQAGNPKNSIAPLPDLVRDPADKLGAVALAVPTVKSGVAVPTGYYAVSVDSVTTSSTEKCKDQPPGDGKQFAIVTLTVKNIWAKELGLFDLGSSDTTVLRDTDNEKYTVLDGSGARKAKRDEAIADNLVLMPGESTTFRHFFEIPKDAKLKSVTFGQGSGRKYMVDLSSTK